MLLAHYGHNSASTLDRAHDRARARGRSLYGDAIPGRVLADRLASYVHLFNLYWYSRCARARQALPFMVG
jgi:hypothetical protein